MEYKKKSSSEIWSDKVSLLHIKGTQRGGEHGGESKQSHGGAEGTKSDRAVVYVLLITLVISSVPPRTNGVSVPNDFCYIKPLCSPCDITSNFKYKWQTLSLQITEDPYFSCIIKKIQKLKFKRALIPFELTPFWLAKDALLRSY